MNIITYLQELLYYFMNKKADRNESNSKVKSQQNTKFYRYSAISDLSISGETFIPEKRITGFHKILLRVIIQIIKKHFKNGQNKYNNFLKI